MKSKFSATVAVLAISLSASAHAAQFVCGSPQSTGVLKYGIELPAFADLSVWQLYVTEGINYPQRHFRTAQFCRYVGTAQGWDRYNCYKKTREFAEEHAGIPSTHEILASNLVPGQIVELPSGALVRSIGFKAALAPATGAKLTTVDCAPGSFQH